MATVTPCVTEVFEEQPSTHLPWWRTLAFAALLGALAVFGYMDFDQYLRPTVTILVFAAILNYLLRPIVDSTLKLIRLEKSHNARVAVVLTLYCVIAVVLYIFGAISMRTIRNNINELTPSAKAMYSILKVDSATEVGSPDYMPSEMPSLQMSRFDYWYKTAVPLEMRTQIWASVQQQAGGSPEMMQGLIAWLLGLAKRGVVWAGMLIEFIFVPLLAYYFLTEAPKVRDSIIYFVPKKKRDIFGIYLDGINTIMGKYVQSQIILGAIAWAVVTLGLVCLGVKGAFILGIIAGVSRIIPMIGPLVGGVPVMAGVLLHEQGSSLFIWVLIGFTLLHLFETKYLMPRILGDNLDIHPVLIVISLLIGYELLGLIGMFLAPPAVAVIRFALAVNRGEHSGPDIPKSLEKEIAEVNPVSG